MMKSYLRYEPIKSFGIISTPQSNSIYDWSGNLAISGSLQSIGVWNLRQSQQIASITPSNSSYPYHLIGTVVSLIRSKDRSTLAAGYSSGEVLIIDYISKSVLATLRGHRAAAISLAYDNSGTLLASGGADSDIIIWDVVNLSGKHKLRGHKDAVTGCVFVPSMTSSSPKYLVSSSKDTLLKVWDMSTQHCIQTIVGHRCEIWSLALIPLSSSEPTELIENDNQLPSNDFLILTGSSDDMIRGYLLNGRDSEFGTEKNQNTSTIDLSDEVNILNYVGSIQSQGGEKCTDIEFSSTGGLLLTITGISSKNIELLRLRNSSEIKKKLKRRAKRLREKNSTTDNSEPITQDTTIDDKPTLEDYFEKLANLKSPHKMKSISFSPHVERDGSYRALGSTTSNSFEVFRITVPNQKQNSDSNSEYSFTKLSVLEMHGHRSDVRSVCISSDGAQVASVSGECVKVWSTKNHSCIRSCATGYGVSMTFITGNRYLLIGTKEGRIQIVDSSNGEMIIDQEAHEGPIWSVALQPPEGKGFMTGGADKIVKFWDFTINNGTLGIELSRQLMMTHDIMCVAYSPVKKDASRLLVAIGLLDHTVKVFYNDSLKFYLSLYGHKLPVMCLDISHDGNILVSGSADKTIKIWGLDFGDCHRSLLAHEDTVTCVKFQPDTHYFFSSGKDGGIKYWDADRFEQILYLPNHISSVWSLAVSPDSSFVLSGGQDRSLRIWERTDDLVFIEEERERAIEAKIEVDIEKRDQHDTATSGELIVPTLPSIESLKGGERIIEALELVEVEYVKSLKSNYHANIILRGMSPLQYMCWTLRDSIKSADLEMALLVIPFHYIHRLLFILLLISKTNIDIEITIRCVIFLVRCHQTRLFSILSINSSTSLSFIGQSDECEDGIELLSLQQIIRELKLYLTTSIESYRNLIGTNLATMKFLTRQLQSNQSYNENNQRNDWTQNKRKDNDRVLSISDQSRNEFLRSDKKKKKRKVEKIEN